MNKIIQITAFIFLSSLLYGQAGSPLDIQSGATIQPENWNIDVKRSIKLGDGIGTDTTSIEGVHRIYWDTTGKSITIGHNILGNFGFALPHYGAIVLDTANDVTNISAITPIGILANRTKNGLSKIMELTENAASLQAQFNDSVKGQVGIWDSTDAQYVEVTIIKNGVDIGGSKTMLHGSPEHTVTHNYLMDEEESVHETQVHIHDQFVHENEIGFKFLTDSLFIIDADTTRIESLGGNGNQMVTVDNSGNLGTADILPYRVYTALVAQTGTSAPTAIILENTLGAVPAWTRTGQGVFELTLNGAFTEDKTFIITQVDYLINAVSVYLDGGWANVNYIEFQSLDSSRSVTDELGRGYVEVRVYE